MTKSCPEILLLVGACLCQGPQARSEPTRALLRAASPSVEPALSLVVSHGVQHGPGHMARISGVAQIPHFLSC